ncbi:MAG: AraC family transcriptional regulator [Steroidobacteraceae bacterium]
MSDPLSEIITLLRPRAVFTKGISGAGRWGVRYTEFGHPGFCAVIEGSCRLAVDGQQPLVLEQGDFVLLPRTPGFTMCGFEEVVPQIIDPHQAANAQGEVRHGTRTGPPSVRLLGGYFLFDQDNAGLLTSLLPAQIHVRGVARLAGLVQMLTDEAARQQPGRELVLVRLVEILLVEALRLGQTRDAAPGLLRGLSDPRLSEALRQMHDHPAQGWTLEKLARKVALSRSAFFERFTRHVGVAPMEYLLGWRMAMAKNLLRGGGITTAEVAGRVGYGSASAFNTAFSRHVGQPPGRFARSALAAARESVFTSEEIASPGVIAIKAPESSSSKQGMQA